MVACGASFRDSRVEEERLLATGCPKAQVRCGVLRAMLKAGLRLGAAECHQKRALFWDSSVAALTRKEGGRRIMRPYQ